MQIDWETADRITLTCLQDNLKTLEKEVDDHLKNGVWMHPEDLENALYKYMPALRIMIKYYGG